MGTAAIRTADEMLSNWQMVPVLHMLRNIRWLKYIKRPSKFEPDFICPHISHHMDNTDEDLGQDVMQLVMAFQGSANIGARLSQ